MRVVLQVQIAKEDKELFLSAVRDHTSAFSRYEFAEDKVKAVLRDALSEFFFAREPVRTYVLTRYRGNSEWFRAGKLVSVERRKKIAYLLLKGLSKTPLRITGLPEDKS